MPNSIKYSTSPQTLALKKGNFWIGVNDVKKGSSSSSGYYTGVNPASYNGYILYLNKASGGPSIYDITSDDNLILLTNAIAGTTYTTRHQCLAYFAGQSDKLIVNKCYPPIVTDSLVFTIDPSFIPSYPESGSAIYDISPSANSGTLINDPIFNIEYLSFDGADDYVTFSSTTSLNLTNTGTISVLINPASLTQGSFANLVAKNIGGSANQQSYTLSWRQVSGAFLAEICGGSGVYNSLYASLPTAANRWYNITFTWDGSNLSFYNNNILQAQLAQTTSCQVLSTDLTIGGYTYKGAGGAGEYFNGDIANVKIYNKALSPAEISQNYYQAPIIVESIAAFYTASNLVSFDRFESGGTGAYYMTGSSHNLNGVLQNGVTYNDDSGGYWAFDGTNDRILLNGATTNAWVLNANTNWTVTAWIRTTTNVGNSLGVGPIFTNSQGGPVYSVMCVNDGKATYWHYNGTWLQKQGTITVNDGEWHMITWVNRSNSTMDIYVDTTLDASNVSSALSSTNYLDIIGGSWAASYSGSISSLQINTIAFTQAQVNTNFEAQRYRFGI